MMWVLRKKKEEKRELLKYKVRAVVCSNQQKRNALASGTEHTLETFAPAARSATFKLLCASDTAVSPTSRTTRCDADTSSRRT
eukprot:4280667-Pleurochrysis_carterae.AAC.1